MSDRKETAALKDEELDKVAGGTGDEEEKNQNLYVGGRAEIYYMWGPFKCSHGGYIRDIQMHAEGFLLYYIDMDDKEYSGWYSHQAITNVHGSENNIMDIKFDSLEHRDA